MRLFYFICSFVETQEFSVMALFKCLYYIGQIEILKHVLLSKAPFDSLLKNIQIIFVFSNQ